MNLPIKILTISTTFRLQVVVKRSNASFPKLHLIIIRQSNRLMFKRKVNILLDNRSTKGRRLIYSQEIVANITQTTVQSNRLEEFTYLTKLNDKSQCLLSNNNQHIYNTITTVLINICCQSKCMESTITKKSN